MIRRVGQKSWKVFQRAFGGREKMIQDKSRVREMKEQKKFNLDKSSNNNKDDNKIFPEHQIKSL